MASSKNKGITINGLDFLGERLASMDEALKVGIDAEMSISAGTIAREAAQAAPDEDNGKIRNAIKENITTPFKKYITVNAEDAAYIEFGTGDFAARYVPTLPDDVQRYAKTFYINGKGITKEQPYLVPAALKEFPALVLRIQKMLEE